MYRFVAFAWQSPHNDRSEEIRQRIAQIEKREGRPWSLAYRANGLEVWHTGNRPGLMQSVPLPDGGVLLGRILSRADGFPDWSPCAIATPASSLDPAEQARWLFANTWGTYVGFLPRKQTQSFAVLRDPSGGLPCYRIGWNGFDVFTSNVDAIIDFPTMKFSINFDYLIVNTLLPLVSKVDTGLNEVGEVLPGECLSIGDESPRKFLWNPIAISQDGLRIDTGDAAELLRDTLRKTVSALVRPYPRILHSLGGLDSSILLTCLKAASSAPDITCVNFYTASFGGDERDYTRSMAAHAGVPLVERRLEPDRVDLDVWRMQEMGPCPPVGFDCLTLAGDFAGLAEELAVDVLSYGTGGDSVFFQAPYIFPALDYVATNGASGRLGRTALEAAQYGGQSLISTVGAMIMERLRPQPCFEAIIKLLDPGILRHYIDYEPPENWASADRLHPMLRPYDKFPKGKYYQIFSSSFFDLEPQRYRFPRNSEIDYVCPLLSQPVVELCLQIPTWQLADGGVNRGLARRAFWQDLPREISGRTSKSTSEGVYGRAFEKNFVALREALLDGILAQAKFFNRKNIEMTLDRSRDRLIATDIPLLFDFYALETWARHWSD